MRIRSWVVLVLTAPSWGSRLRSRAARRPTRRSVRPWGVAKFTFDDARQLARWTVKGDVAVDATKGRDGAAALRVGPGGVAVFKLQDADGSGKVELWVYDDGTQPENPKASRVGPRWGLVAERRQGAGRRHPLRQLSRRQRGLHGHRLRRQGLVRPAVLAGRQPRAGAGTTGRSTSTREVGPADPPRRQGTQRVRSRARPA